MSLQKPLLDHKGINLQKATNAGNLRNGPRTAEQLMEVMLNFLPPFIQKGVIESAEPCFGGKGDQISNAAHRGTA